MNEKNNSLPLIDSAIEVLSRAVYKKMLGAEIMQSSFGEYTDLETLACGQEVPSLIAKCMSVKNGLHELWLVVHDDACRRLKKGCNREKLRHAIAKIFRFYGPVIDPSDNVLMKTIKSGGGPKFLVCAFDPEKGIVPPEPSNGVVFTLENSFLPFLDNLIRGERGAHIEFKAPCAELEL